MRKPSRTPSLPLAALVAALPSLGLLVEPLAGSEGEARADRIRVSSLRVAQDLAGAPLTEGGLVSGLPTLLRVDAAYEDIAAEEIGGVPVEVYGYRSGEALAGSPLSAASGGIVVRHAREAAWSFSFPPSWTAAGEPIDVTVVIDPMNLLGECETCYDDNIAEVTLSFAPGVEALPAEDTFIRGDTTGEGAVDLADSVRILDHLFRGGEAPRCLDAADVNDDGTVNIADAVFLLEALYSGGAQPPSPGAPGGHDPTPDDLPSCSSSATR